MLSAEGITTIRMRWPILPTVTGRNPAARILSQKNLHSHLTIFDPVGSNSTANQGGVTASSALREIFKAAAEMVSASP